VPCPAAYDNDQQNKNKFIDPARVWTRYSEAIGDPFRRYSFPAHYKFTIAIPQRPKPPNCTASNTAETLLRKLCPSELHVVTVY